MPCYGRERCDRTTWGIVSLRPKTLRERIFGSFNFRRHKESGLQIPVGPRLALAEAWLGC
eukprot:7938609-Alexandrium_andersonii.AAC.1